MGLTDTMPTRSIIIVCHYEFKVACDRTLELKFRMRHSFHRELLPALNVDNYVFAPGFKKSCIVVVQYVVEPSQGLQESLLVSIFVLLHSQVPSSRESMHHSTEEVDLPRLTCLGKNTFQSGTKFRSEDRLTSYPLQKSTKK